MRAGLLSQPEVIQRLNRDFVCSTLSYAELWKLAKSGNELAREVNAHWKIPLVLVFLDAEGRFVTDLSSLKSLTEVHPDTTRRTEARQYHCRDANVNNRRVFLKHLSKFFSD